MNDTDKSVLADIGRQVRENTREWERQRKAKWAKENPRMAAATTGWGKAFRKEGHKLVDDIDRGLKSLFGL